MGTVFECLGSGKKTQAEETSIFSQTRQGEKSILQGQEEHDAPNDKNETANLVKDLRHPPLCHDRRKPRASGKAWCG